MNFNCMYDCNCIIFLRWFLFCASRIIRYNFYVHWAQEFLVFFSVRLACFCLYIFISIHFCFYFFSFLSAADGYIWLLLLLLQYRFHLVFSYSHQDSANNVKSMKESKRITREKNCEHFQLSAKIFGFFISFFFHSITSPKPLRLSFLITPYHIFLFKMYLILCIFFSSFSFNYFKTFACFYFSSFCPLSFVVDVCFWYIMW